jgi:hypothetical protein
LFESGHHGRLFQVAIIRLFQLRRWYVANRFQQPSMIKTVDPFQGGIFNGIDVLPKAETVEAIEALLPGKPQHGSDQDRLSKTVVR